MHIYDNTHTWKDEDSVTVEDMLLLVDKYPDLYHRASKLDLIEQLSAKGIALLSYLYSLKDDNPVQPIVASTTDDYKKLIREFAQTVPGTEITVILQLTDIKGFFEIMAIHKTVAKLERTQDGVNFIHIDSVDNKACQYVATEEFKKVANELGIAFNLYLQEEIKFNDKAIGRQADGHQCGVFAVKDARELQKKPNVAGQLKTKHVLVGAIHGPARELPNEFIYEIPPQFYKGVQSFAAAVMLADKYKDIKVNTEGETLSNILDNHGKGGYIKHFSIKYRDKVMGYVSTHTKAQVVDAIAAYDAANVTAPIMEARHRSRTLS